MIPVPEECADKPNLWRLACELSKFEDPEKALALGYPAMKYHAGLWSCRGSTVEVRFHG